MAWRPGDGVRGCGLLPGRGPGAGRLDLLPQLHPLPLSPPRWLAYVLLLLLELLVCLFTLLGLAKQSKWLVIV